MQHLKVEQPLAKDRAKLFLMMSSAPVTNIQLLFVVIMDLDETIADIVKTLESFVVSVKTHQIEFKNKYRDNTFFHYERSQGKSQLMKINN